MRALLFDGHLQLKKDYPDPKPVEGEALIRVTMAGVCATDIEILRGYMGFRGVPGHEFTGVVEGCKDPALIGKRVVGEINVACGKCPLCKRGLERHCPSRSVLGILGRDGAFAEYITLPEENLHTVPEALSDEEAVFTEPVAAAFEILEGISITTDRRVAVLGDGRLGLLSAQVLKTVAPDTTIIGRHREKLAIAEGLGIKSTLTDSYAKESAWDIVVDCTSSPEGLSRAIDLVLPRGTVVLKTTTSYERRVDMNRIVIDEISIVGSRCGPFGPALKALAEGTVKVRPLISKIFPLDEGVRALEFATGPGVLKVLIRV